MSRRRDVFYKGGYYHIYNKTLNKNKIFLNSAVAERFLGAVAFYKHPASRKLKYSRFLDRSEWDRLEFLSSEDRLCEILAYCLMPNHYHLLIKQTTDIPISNIMAHIIDSVTQYYNQSNEHVGPVFLSRFKSKIILSEEQLIHVARYIHLNPFSSGLVKTTSELKHYPDSSYGVYLNNRIDNVVDESFLDQYFSIASNQNNFVKSTEDQADWQKTLEYVKNPDKWS